MFQFTAFPSVYYGFIYGWQRFALPGFPIRTSTGCRLFAPNRGFSQLTASFFGSSRQGILPMLLFAWFSCFIWNDFALSVMICEDHHKRLFRMWSFLLCLVFKVLWFSNSTSFSGSMTCARFASRISMETTRFELVTPCLQGRCSPSWATPPLNFPGSKWTRTTDLTLIRRAL